ncbi:M28 family peptidase [Streptomyces flavidovirens]|uniref:M28 family metallopeptidase n=1 Tax=Streptomyces flavidovirens TaxID=67298 RepID=UPI00343AE518
MVLALVRELNRRADPRRLRHDVEFLADRPRSRTRAPEAMLRAEAHVMRELAAAGWRTERQPFDVRWRLGGTDRQNEQAIALQLRLHTRLTGANLVAGLPGADDRPTVVVGAHLDTVDDNASGVAALLEIARLLGGLPQPPAVTLLFFDMEELG